MDLNSWNTWESNTEREGESSRLRQQIQQIEENQVIRESRLTASHAEINHLVEKAQSLSNIIMEQQGTIQFQAQQIAMLEAEAQGLREERHVLLDSGVIIAERNSQLEEEKAQIETALNQSVQESHQLRSTRDLLFQEGKATLTSFAKKVKAIEEKATPFHIPNQEGRMLYEEAKGLLKKWKVI